MAVGLSFQVWVNSYILLSMWFHKGNTCFIVQCPVFVSNSAIDRVSCVSVTKLNYATFFFFNCRSMAVFPLKAIRTKL